MNIEYDRSIIEIILDHAVSVPDRPALVFDLGDGPISQFTYSELSDEIRNLTGAITAQGLAGRRLGLLFSPGLDFVLALLACLAAGSVAVPMAPIGRRKARLNNLLGLMAEFDPEALIIDSSMAKLFGRELAGALDASTTRYVEFDGLEKSRVPVDPVPVRPEDLAVMQFTSGTTSHPKGVMITHGNIIADETIIREAFGHDQNSHFVGWVPHYHDQGLFGNVLQPLFLGSTCVLTSPSAFINRPLLWLELISKYRAHTSGGPNFGYDLCVDYANRRGVSDIDLSSWRVAFNGAERVRPKTLARFTDCFSGVGFDERAFLPCYGLAECTLVTVATQPWTLPIARHKDSSALSTGYAQDATAEHGSIELTCCGPAMEGSEALVVDPDTHRVLSHGEVGEVWLRGPHIAVGYWNDRVKTEAVFGAHLESGEGPYLRTGDLAFSEPEGFYIVGRIRDLIILRGRNFAPSDLEHIWSELTNTVGQARAAAVQVEVGDDQHVILIAEVRRSEIRNFDQASLQATAQQLRAAAMEQLDLSVTDLVMVIEGAIPRTTSGKVQRGKAAQLLVECELPIIGVAGPIESYLSQHQKWAATVTP